MTAQIPREEVFIALDQKVKECLAVFRNFAKTSFAVLQEQFDLEGDPVWKF